MSIIECNKKKNKNNSACVNFNETTHHVYFLGDNCNNKSKNKCNCGCKNNNNNNNKRKNNCGNKHYKIIADVFILILHHFIIQMREF